MYLPSHFDEPRLEVQHALIRSHPFGLLVSGSQIGPQASALPFVLAERASPLGTLTTHVARGNDHWRHLIDDGEVLAVFQGPHAYVSPRLYPSTRETGRVAPTWNYTMVHARGRARVIDDTTWLRSQVQHLTARMEGDGPDAWSVNQAPSDHVDSMLKGIVGIEIVIEHIEGKWKASQNRHRADRAGVVEGLRRSDSQGRAMAEIVNSLLIDARKP